MAVRITLRLQQADLPGTVDADETVRHRRGAHGVDGRGGLPSVPFLKPTGIDRPEAISRCVCDSVVRAPIADQLNRSPRYCGLLGSSASVASGSPILTSSTSRRRAIFRPPSTSNEPSMCGSLISPFQPTVVRGFQNRRASPGRGYR